MKATGDPLLLALDALDAPVDFFLRDDDAGWSDPRLMALLDTTAACATPIDLAVIPAALTAPLARQLLQRRRHQALGLHQHGWSHTNHEPEGRKSEFGGIRLAAERELDIVRGARRLQDLLGADVDPIFTPPWNRCADELPMLLRRLGFTALSRSASAPPQHALAELPVRTDWCRQWREAIESGSDAATRIAADLARHVRPGARIGLMLHHAAMADDELTLLARLLRRWTTHPNARWQPMHALLTKATA
jgi:hypothetical protein